MTAPEQQEHRASAQLTYLHALTLALSGATTTEAVADAIVQHVPPALATDACIVAALNGDGLALTLLRANGFLADVSAPGDQLPLDGPSALAGSISAASREGAGSTFTIRLPLA